MYFQRGSASLYFPADTECPEVADEIRLPERSADVDAIPPSLEVWLSEEPLNDIIHRFLQYRDAGISESKRDTHIMTDSAP
jgi:hypothetical protein